MPLRTQKYSVFRKTTAITYNAFCVLCLFSITSPGQCVTLKWLDSDLHYHTGFFNDHIRISEYNYFYGEYKKARVSQILISDKSTSRIRQKQSFDTEGFLIEDEFYTSAGNLEMHRYTYSNNRLTVFATTVFFVRKTSSRIKESIMVGKCWMM